MAVRVNIKKDFGGIKPRVNQMTKLGQYALAHQVHQDSNHYAPKRSGDMRIQSYVSGDNKQIIWNAPYARAQYYGRVGKGRYPVRKYTTPGTGPKWDQKAKSIHIKEWEKIVGKAMK